MPTPDPLPSPNATEWRRLRRAIRWLAGFAVAIAALAVAAVMQGETDIHPHMIVATALGVGLTVFIGGGLSLLIFFSARSGHDEAAGESHQDKDKE